MMMHWACAGERRLNCRRGNSKGAGGGGLVKGDAFEEKKFGMQCAAD